MMLLYDTHSLSFYSISNCHGYDLDGHSDADPLEQFDSSVVAGSSAHERYEVMVVDGEADEGGEDYKAPE